MKSIEILSAKHKNNHEPLKKNYKYTVGKGEPVVIIHGWSCDSRYMQPIIDQLSKSYEVISIDLPGCGQNEWLPFIKSIHDIADMLLPHLPPKAIYVAWSFGSLVTISLAGRYPQYVKQIIGIGANPKFVQDDNWPGIPLPGFKASFSKEIKSLGFKRFFQGFIDSEFSDFQKKPQGYTQLKKLLEDTKDPDITVLLSGLNICDNTDLRNEFKAIKCPIDLILGSKDPSVPVDSHEAMQQLNSSARIHVINDAYHMMFWTHPKEFQEILDNILKSS